MNITRTLVAVGWVALVLSVAMFERSVFASGTKSATATTQTKPADLIDSKDLAGRLLKEGQRIEIVGTLSKGDGGRYMLTSAETKKAYKVLENSLLGSMVDTSLKKTGQTFKAVARVTVYQNENFLFITRVELSK